MKRVPKPVCVLRPRALRVAQRVSGWIHRYARRMNNDEETGTADLTGDLSGTYVPSTWDWVADQVALYERSNGTEGNTLRDTGIPVVLVTMIGKTSGNVRKIALMRVEHEGSYALVASVGGRPENPKWYTNLVANPDNVMLQDGPAPFPVTVREVSGDERQQWWERAAAVFPTYEEYRVKTERVIPVLVASPRAV